MNIKNQKILAAKVAGVGIDRVILVPERLNEIKEAITKADIRALIKSGAIKILDAKTPSRARAKKRHAQRLRGRRKGHGKRKGSAKARSPSKTEWIKKIRLMRKTLKNLKAQGKLDKKIFNEIYRKAKGGFFRDKGHLLFYLEQNKLLKTK
jgi:large subunit ribosomal protein L19e